MVTITSPVQYQLFQRDTITGQISISGSYSGSPTAIEASFNGGAYGIIDSSPSGGMFSGVLDGAIGQGTLLVRGIGDDTDPVSVSNVAVGDIYWVIGQSNALGHATNNQSAATATPVTVSSAAAWGLFGDPNSAGYGTPYPLLAQLIWDDGAIPTAFINTAEGSSAISQHQSDSAWADPGPVTARYVDSCEITKIRAFLFYQGESDSTPELASSYLAGLRSSLAFYRGLFADSPPVFVVRMHGAWDGDGTDTKQVQAAQAIVWGDDGILPGPDLIGMTASGDVHWESDAEMIMLARKWFNSLDSVFNFGADQAHSIGTVIL